MNQSNVLRPGILAFCIFLVSVNLLAGFVATTFNYPSLYNVTASFGEYAVPLPFNWALAHWPSMLIYGVPLLFLRRPGDKFTQYFRLFCALSFGLLLLELDKKIPFLLFPKVDALTALILSLVVLPPNRKDSPVLVAALKVSLAGILGITGFFAYSYWVHQAPSITTTRYADGFFELTGITINNDFRKEMLFEMEIKEHLSNGQPCILAQQVANGLLRDYPFDNAYNKQVEVIFNPPNPDAPENVGAPYSMGEISLNTGDMGPDGEFPCYLTYKNDIF